MRKFLLFSTILGFIITAGDLWAQERTISGKVTSVEDGTALPGVNVILKGTTTGTVTDIEGNYTLSVPSTGGTLVFSFIGLASEEIAIGSQSVIDIQMSEDVTQLSEVVVVGYGTTTKQSFVGTAKSVDASKIETKSFTNVAQAMAGEVAGVSVINTSGQPGNVSTVRIRGFGSVNGNRNPLYVVDGVPLTNDDDGVTGLNAINPADIASYTVLKDATATAIYGSRGANGVIVITTKGGRKDRSAIDVEYKRGVNMSYLPRYDVIESPEEYIALTWEGMKNRGASLGELNPVAYANDRLFTNGIPQSYNMWNVTNGAELIDPNTGKVRSDVTRKYNPEDWEDHGFQSAQRHEGNIRFSGGSDKSSHYISLGYLNDNGYIINSDFTRYSVRSNLNQNITKWLTATANIGYTVSDQNRNGQSNDSGSIFWFVDNLPPIYPLFLRDSEGNKIEDPYYGGYEYDYGIGRAFGALTNSIGDAHYDKINYKTNQLLGNIAFNIDFTDYLSFETRYGVQLESRNYTNMGSPFYGSSATSGGSLYRELRDDLTQNFLQMLRFNKTFGASSIDALVAHESNGWERKYNIASKRKAVHPSIDDFNNYVIVTGQPVGYTLGVALESYFGQLNYNYDGRYFLSGSVRRDGSSRFVNDKWGTFGSVGAAWVLSEESFLKQVSVIDFLKLKASYGIMGEQAGVGYYPGYNTFDIGNLNDNISLTPRDNGNPDLTWETSKMFQAGLEFELLAGKIEGSIDYYQKNTDNLLFDRRVGPSQGIAIVTVNDGVLLNKGLEYDLTGHIINNGSLTLDLGINGEIISNEIKTMPIEPATGEPKLIDTSNSPYGMAEGHSIFDFYMIEWAGVDPSDGVGMWYQYYNDINNNGEVDSDEGILDMEQYVGSLDENTELNLKRTTTKTYANATNKFVGKSAIPKLRGGFRLAASYKGISLTAQFLYSIGGYAYDNAYAQLMNNPTAGNNNWHKDIYSRWQKPGDVTDVPRLSEGFDTNVASRSTRFLTKSDYLALNNVKIGYQLPDRIVNKLFMTGLNVWLSGDNLMLKTHRNGFNPSTSETGSSSTYRYTPLTTLSVGVRASF
ncbi:TonB-dependent receptor [Fulvivirga imtechensis AK7]|uniref:TonB-dependent receptor n=1 Tax=Fulvivirga imtechensis AK7 TaxID=1237149 RepID=L8JPX0_9BACT|nr:SusC/RagA family TonB-linked outer membrane protein [Fulvivirga imtechensis]ELR69427.1 TonB-dependent receptor [Fulvivirga imtechensis AK7]